MKKNFLILYLILCAFASQGQNTNTYLNNYVQPAPNVAALGKYVDFPVSYYTGVPSISIPVYELKDGVAKLPISISYHASGIRVSEVASWVGLGWALNAGGVIIRTVRGAPDEGARKAVWPFALGPHGYYADSGLKTLALLPHPTSTSNGNVIVGNTENQTMVQATIPAINGGSMDCEPDLYTFNFNGYTGKFIFDENRTPRLLVDDNLKISVNFGSSAFNSWVITTPDGARYYFGENNMHEVTAPQSTVSDDDINSQVPSSWYLTKIIYPNSKDTIKFYYSPEIYSYRDLGTESSTYPNFTGYPPTLHSFYTACGNYITVNVITSTVTGIRLDSIKSKNYNVVFVAKTLRQDLISNGINNYPYSLDSIKVFNSQRQCLKQFALTHSYFTSTAGSTCPAITTFVNFYNDTTDRKRLKLSSFTEYSGDGTFNKPSYIITYDESLQLPRRLSYDQDHWGFSNNSSGSSNQFFTPQVSSGLCAYPGYGGGSNRSPNWPAMSAFTLTTIRDPLGVNTIFQYEANSAENIYPVSIVGGLRIKQISTKDSVTGSSAIRKFSYGGGALYKEPKYLIIPNNEFFLYRGSGSGQVTGYKGYSSNLVVQNMIKQSQSVVPLQDAQGNHIGYPLVTETFGPNGEGGSKVYRFQVDFMPGGNSRLDMSNYTALALIYTMYGNYLGIYGNGLFNQILPQNLVYYSHYDMDDYYPAAPQQIDLKRGRLLGEYTYDSTGNLIQSVDNSYQEIYNENYSTRGFKVARLTSYMIGGANPTPINNDALTYYKLRTGVSRLISTTNTDFKDGKVMSSTTRYGYESAYHTLRTSDTTVSSQGDSIITKTYYSFDYANNATPDTVFGKMKSRNLLLPVATRVWKNNQLLSGTVTLFKDFATNAADSFINPLKVYGLETTAPLTTIQAGENIALAGQFNTLLPNSYFKEKASFTVNSTTGKIIEQKLVNDKNQALIWENNYSLPLAQVDNALFSDIAYSSFETAESGNWTYSSGSVLSEPTAPTGSKAYNISGGISKSGLIAAQKYIISYWLKTGGSVSITGGTQSNNVTGRVLNGWTYKQVTITGTTSVSISGSGSIDELRLHPSLAQMNTYTYDAMLRLIATCSANNTISYYEYDSMNRVTDIKDQNGNVIKAFEYNYGRLSRPGQ